MDPLSKYRLMLEIGKGAYGTVWKSINTETGKTVALKSINIPNDDVKKLINNEVEILKDISKPQCNPFLTCFNSSFYVKDTLYIEMEYIDGQTLDKFAKFYRDKGDLESLYKYLAAMSEDLLKGLNYLHSKKIIHRDIKPENIMISKNNIPKIIDIGLGCFAKETCMRRKAGMIFERDCCLGKAGSPIFMAPETLINGKSYYASDIWSLGATLYYVAKNDHMYSAYNLPDLIDQVKKDPVPRLQTSNTQLNRIVNSTLKKKVSLRPTAQELLFLLFDKK